MKRCVVLGLVAAGLVACGPVDGVGGEAARVPVGHGLLGIVGGTLDTGDPAVVVLAAKSQGSYFDYCTGTLIGSKTVLTAAHCINANQPDPGYVIIGNDVNAPVQAIAMAQQVKNPNYHGGDHDVGVIRLATAVSNVTPIPMNQTAMDSSWVGRTIRHAGFGVTNGPNQTGSGLKREVSYTLRQVGAWEIESGASGKQTCNGDSGGPAFMVPPGGSTEVLVGVVSWGDQDCLVEGWDGRVDMNYPWIKSTMSWETPTCATDGACVPGCTPIDQDCACASDGVCSLDCQNFTMDPDCPKNCGQDGVCATAACPRADTDCAPVGGACITGIVCQSRLCTTDAQHQPYCSQGCSGPSDCPSTMDCGTDQQCHFKPLPEVGLGAVCDATVYCTSGICNGPVGDGYVTRCVKACVSQADCTGSATCEGGRTGVRYCRPADVSFTPAPIPLAPEKLGLADGFHPFGCSTGAGPVMAWLGLLAPLLRRRRATHEGSDA